MRTEYRALVAKVEGFTRSIESRRADDLSCGAGCASCCHAWLTVSAVEADELREALAGLAPALRRAVQARGRRELAREAEAHEGGEATPRCAMLDDDGRCSVYHARPLVCRTQGHALRYPAGLIPAELVTQRLSNGEVTWCPLNYTAAAPAGADVLDAERVDQILGVVARRHAEAVGHAHDARTSLSALAAEWDVLHDGTARDHESDESDQSGSAQSGRE